MLSIWVDEGQSDRLAGQSDSSFCEVQSDTSLARLGLTFFSQSDAQFFIFSYITYFSPALDPDCNQLCEYEPDCSSCQIARLAALPDWPDWRQRQIGPDCHHRQTDLGCAATRLVAAPDCQIGGCARLPDCQSLVHDAHPIVH